MAATHQPQLDFSEGDRLEALYQERRQRLLAKLSAAGYGPTSSVARLCLLVLLVTKRTGGALTWSAARIGADPTLRTSRGPLSPRTVRRLVAAAEAAGVLVREAYIDPHGGMRGLSLSIDFAALWQEEDRATCPQLDPDIRADIRADISRASYISCIPVFQEPPPPSREDWEGVVVVLSELGLGDIDGAMADAQAKRLTPAEAMAIAEHFRAHAGEHGWSPGVLRYRLKNAVAGEDPTRRWPPAKRGLPHVRAPTPADQAQAAERAAHAIVRAGRRAQQTDEQIEAELNQRGLLWPGRNLSPGT